MNKVAKKITHKARLMREVNELLQYKAGSLMSLKIAHAEVAKLSSKNYMGSGVIITIQNISGVNKVDPVLITDGLSQSTIDAIQADIKRSSDLRIALGNIPD